jgi:hypothetical protein
MDMSMNMSTVNVILDIVLIAASFWMVFTVRGLGGVIGRGLNMITIGAVILGIAHLLATGVQLLDGTMGDMLKPADEGFVHRIIVLVGFIVLVAGFRRIEQIKR